MFGRWQSLITLTDAVYVELTPLLEDVMYYRERFGLPALDCVHAAMVMASGADGIATVDGAFGDVDPSLLPIFMPARFVPDHPDERGPRDRPRSPYPEAVSAPRSRLSIAVVLTMMLAGCVIVVFAARALLRDPTDDTAWVAVALGVAVVAWAVAFDRLSDETDGTPTDATTTDGTTTDGTDVPAARPRWTATGVLSTAVGVAGGYVVVRMIGRPVDSALVGALTWPAWRLVNRAVDALVRRREGGGAAGGGGAEPGGVTD